MTHHMDRPEIRLIRGRLHWLAQFVGDRRLVGLVGGDTIPTAFAPQTDAQTVLRAIQALNPNASVRVIEGRAR